QRLSPRHAEPAAAFGDEMKPRTPLMGRYRNAPRRAKLAATIRRTRKAEVAQDLAQIIGCPAGVRAGVGTGYAGCAGRIAIHSEQPIMEAPRSIRYKRL